MAHDPDTPTDTDPSPPCPQRTTIAKASYLMASLVAEAFVDVGDEVTVMQLRGLLLIVSRPSATVRELSEVNGGHLSSAARLFARLEEAGLVKRKRTRRGQELNLTAAGRGVVLRYTDVLTNLVVKELAAAGPEHIEAVLRGSQAMIDAHGDVRYPPGLGEDPPARPKR